MNVKPGFYTHFKRGVYLVVGNAFVSDNNEYYEVVVYYSPVTGDFYTRRLESFSETVLMKFTRFERIPFLKGFLPFMSDLLRRKANK